MLHPRLRPRSTSDRHICLSVKKKEPGQGRSAWEASTKRGLDLLGAKGNEPLPSADSSEGLSMPNCAVFQGFCLGRCCPLFLPTPSKYEKLLTWRLWSKKALPCTLVRNAVGCLAFTPVLELSPCLQVSSYQQGSRSLHLLGFTAASGALLCVVVELFEKHPKGKHQTEARPPI